MFWICVLHSYALVILRTLQYVLELLCVGSVSIPSRLVSIWSHVSWFCVDVPVLSFHITTLIFTFWKLISFWFPVNPIFIPTSILADFNLVFIIKCKNGNGRGFILTNLFIFIPRCDGLGRWICVDEEFWKDRQNLWDDASVFIHLVKSSLVWWLSIV